MRGRVDSEPKAGDSMPREKSKILSIYTSAFSGLSSTQENAEAVIRSTMQNPARTFYGDTVIDVYNAAGQGVRFDRTTNVFKGFLEAAKATQ